MQWLRRVLSLLRSPSLTGQRRQCAQICGKPFLHNVGWMDPFYAEDDDHLLHHHNLIFRNTAGRTNDEMIGTRMTSVRFVLFPLGLPQHTQNID